MATVNGQRGNPVPESDEDLTDEVVTGDPFGLRMVVRLRRPSSCTGSRPGTQHESATASPGVPMDDPDFGFDKRAIPPGLQFAYAALGIPLAMLVLSWFVPFMRPRWDSSAIPILSLFGGLIPALMAVVLSLRVWRRRSRRAVTGLLLGLAAVPVCLAISYWLAMQGIASHPV